MDMQALLAPDAAAALGESRARVLDLLRSAGRPLGVQEVAEQAGLHPNTARFHLDALVDAGPAARESQPRETPGRPSMAYRITGSDGPAGPRRYRLLAEMLTSMIAGVMPDPGEAAAEAGREWGRYLTEPPPPYQRLDAGQAIGKLTTALAEIGFAPEAVAEGNGCRLRLHQCPFREVAERHQDVVCALHLGLMQGVLEQLRAPVRADRLLPFAEPGACIAELTTGAQTPQARSGSSDRGPGRGDDGRTVGIFTSVYEKIVAGASLSRARDTRAGRSRATGLAAAAGGTLFVPDTRCRRSGPCGGPAGVNRSRAGGAVRS